MVLRFPEDDIIGEEDHVQMAGAVEFQTQTTPVNLTDVCDPDEIFQPEMQATHRFRVVYDPAIQRGIKDTSSGPKEFLREKQIKDMISDIDANRFECPQLMWNLRAGETVWVYIKESKELLIYDEYTLSEIAYRLGYSSSQHLSGQFKAVTGLTPTAFRRGKGKRRPLDQLTQ
ncbi:MAG: helix-turn-helix transcriptional regulator [Candidatus Marinimicrobia bacterium]|nr:helix-turn-helix transcriptional regulator [Candidatus Neomarinimicrobiota bacterium]